MSRHEDFMKAMIAHEELRMAQANKQSDNVAEMAKAMGMAVDMVVECIQAIQAALGPNFKYYLQGNVMKYLWRFDYKDKPIEDLDKADWYLERLREEVMANDAS